MSFEFRVSSSGFWVFEGRLGQAPRKPWSEAEAAPAAFAKAAAPLINFRTHKMTGRTSPGKPDIVRRRPDDVGTQAPYKNRNSKSVIRNYDPR